MTDIQPSKKDIDDNKLMAVLSYIGILCFIPLLLKKDSPFAQYHAKQGLALFIVEIIASVLSWTIILAWASAIIWLVTIIASIYGMVNAWNGKRVEIPGLKMIVDKLNI